MRKSQTYLGMLMVLVGLLVLTLAACDLVEPSPAPSPAHPVLAPTATPSDLVGDSVRGGRLYDTWWVVLGQDAPDDDHPLWALQTSNTRSGADTWRCVECHGWDYRGWEGAYSEGPHYTGFDGIYAVRHQSPLEILAMLKGSTNPDHDFSIVMDEQALTDLALFLKQELLDMSLLVDAEGIARAGDSENGETLFEENCLSCHSPPLVGAVAQEDPWRFLHKTFFGYPGVRRMSPGVDIGLNFQEYRDLLVYAQAQKIEVSGAATAEGARLYDTWWLVTGASEPAEDYPLWGLQSSNTRSGAETWRCVECHGWDYRGSEGVYGSGSHYTGFVGVYGATERNLNEIIAILSGGTNSDHDFSGVLDSDALTALASFLQQGQVDLSAYIDADGTALGDVENGQALFEANCMLCHGQDGKTINFGEESPLFVGTLAKQDPWRFYHRVLFGLPAGGMPAGVNLGWTPQDMTDLIRYSQTLPE